MNPVIISSPHLGDGEHYCVATTPRDLDVIAYVVLCNDLEGYLPGQDPMPPTPPEIFMALPECGLKNKAQVDWNSYLGRVDVRKEFRAVIEKIEARDPTGCWDLLPKDLVYVENHINPLEFLDDEDYQPRTQDPME